MEFDANFKTSSPIISARPQIGAVQTIHGKDGKDGKDGKSAYQSAVENGFKGSETEWLESLKGEDGEPGYTPVRGIDYWTEADKAAIVLDVLEQIPEGGGGGGGGGGAPSNNAVLTLTNTSGWISKTFSFGSPAPVSFSWSSIEQGMATGDGVLKITVNDVVKKSVQIKQGDHTIDTSEYLAAGDNTVQISIRDKYGNNQTIIFNQTVISLVLNSGFDSKVAYTGAIAYTYTPVAAVEKTMHFKVDGEEIGTYVHA